MTDPARAKPPDPAPMRLVRIRLQSQGEAIAIMRTDCHVCRSEGVHARTRIEIRSGGRGYGARRGLGDHQTRGRDDGHHDRRRPVARQAADTMLVHDAGRGPGQPVADGHHRPRQTGRLGVVKRQGRSRRQEGRDLGIAQPAGLHVAQDRRETALVQPPAV